MPVVEIAFRAFDPHELLWHLVAVRSGLYDDAGLRPRLADATFDSNAAANARGLQVSCGTALIEALEGRRLRVLSAASDRPMFWLYAQPGIRSFSELSGRRVAAYPAGSPPGVMLRIIARRHGLDPDAELTVVPGRDDLARIGMLRTGGVDAAVVSSALPPGRLALRGVTRLLCFGDHVRVPSTGLAASAELERSNPALVAVLEAISHEAQTTLHSRPELAAAIVAEMLECSPAVERRAYRELEPLFTADGTVTRAVAQAAVAEFAAELGVDAVDADRIYGSVTAD
jgi:ABC-type nitrate/sulfonate/bicarbonate transport system substrate-binding protein